MHPNPVYRTIEAGKNLDFARERGFGVLALSVDGAAPLLSHVPFRLSDSGESVELHLVRSNPIVRALTGPRPARIAVSGADSYISPDWYGLPDQVPTWNYVAVHLTGTLEKLGDDALRGVLDRQSALFEDRLRPKAPWRTDKMDPEVLERMMRMIVACRMQVTAVDGTWKLNQNKPYAARLRAADQVEAYGEGADAHILAALMRGAGGQG